MAAEHERFREVWTERDGRTLGALINGELGMLLFLREPGDPGLSSRDPGYRGPPHEMLEYVLENGQRDFYPRGWAIPVEQVERALELFRTTGRRPGFVTWHDDASDRSPPALRV